MAVARAIGYSWSWADAPWGSNDIGDGFIFLRAGDVSACLIDGCVGAFIQENYHGKGYVDFEDDWLPYIVHGHSQAHFNFLNVTFSPNWHD